MKKKIYKFAPVVLALLFVLLTVIVFARCKEEIECKEEAESCAANSVVVVHVYHHKCECEENEVKEEAQEEKLEEEQKVNAEELEMLSCLIYREAGADAVCNDCRRRVADVVLNRINSDKFPDTMYEVLTQKKQYGTMHYDGITWPERANKPEEAHAVERAYDIARDVLSGNHSELYGKGYIWQAEFEQGSSGFWHCGIYFGK